MKKFSLIGEPKYHQSKFLKLYGDRNMLAYENEHKGSIFVTYATCRHCGHRDKLSEFTHTLFDPTEGLIYCPHPDCATHDEGVFLSLERK